MDVMESSNRTAQQVLVYPWDSSESTQQHAAEMLSIDSQPPDKQLVLKHQ